jgi:hypothetical protein
MQFDDQFIDQVNKAIETSGENDFEIKYKSGYPVQDPRYSYNELTEYKAVYARLKDFHIQLTFSKPVWVSSADK